MDLRADARPEDDSVSLVVWYFLLMLNMGDATVGGSPPAIVVSVGVFASAGECATYRDGLVSKLGETAYGWTVTDCIAFGPPQP